MFVFHVQCLFVIIVMSCRLLKIRCDKTQFVSSSRTSKNIFQNVLKAMSKHAPENLGQYVQVKWYLDLLTSEAIPYVGLDGKVCTTALGVCMCPCMYSQYVHP